jgi:hypothetical protein
VALLNSIHPGECISLRSIDDHFHFAFKKINATQATAETDMPSDEEIRKILKEPGTSNWMKLALSTALPRDPVDAANDAELLAIVLSERARKIGERAAAEVSAMAAIQRARRSS